jgi:hypothetical protein
MENASGQACRYGNAACVRELLGAPDIQVNAAGVFGGLCSPLHYACMYGFVDCVRELLQSSATDVKATEMHGDTPLQLACKYTHLECVRVLARHSGVSRELLSLLHV